MTVRIVLADDHAVVVEGLRALLSTVDGFVVVGTAATGTEAVRAAVTERPDVLVMDIQMPGVNGIEATREVGRVAPQTAVLMLTMFDDDESLFAAMRAGAVGYVLKGRRRTASSGRSPRSRRVRRSSRPESRRGPCPTCIGNPRRARPSPNCRLASGRYSTWSPRASPTRRSPGGWCCRRTRSATTSRASSRSCRSPAAPRRSSGPAARASADYLALVSLPRSGSAPFLRSAPSAAGADRTKGCRSIGRWGRQG